MSEIQSLLSRYSIGDIIIFLALVAAAVKGVASFVGWVLDQKNKVVGEEIAKKQQAEKIDNQLKQQKTQLQKLSTNQAKISANLAEVARINKQNYNDIQYCKKGLQHSLKQHEKIGQALDSINSQIHRLVKSDKEDIKSAITKDYHHFCEQKKWIDDYSLNCLENRFSTYVEQGGNSFIEHMMQEIRALPRSPQK